MRIAIIGTGISGLTCAYLLHNRHHLTVFERNTEIGGHTATKRVQLDGVDYDIDTGFIVFNHRTYPNFRKLLDRLGVLCQPTSMGFSVSCEQSGLEYNGTSFNGLFAQRRNLLRPAFLGMLRDILRFNRQALHDLERGNIAADTTLGEYLRQRGYGEWFANRYLVPMGAAIWSSSLAGMLDFPLLFFIRFFKNHGLLTVTDQPQWRVIPGGSKNYLKPLVQGFEDRILTDTPLQTVTRQGDEVLVTAGGRTHVFDQVVFACHSDEALAMLADASAAEQEILGAMAYHANEVVLHTDARLLPKQRRAWAAWNYRIKPDPGARPTLTYNMNILQGITSPQTFCVTLNDTGAIDPRTILGRFQYSHPVFTLESVSAAERWSEINGVNRSWYSGAYWANGFHEDGCNSGIRVATALGAEW